MTSPDHDDDPVFVDRRRGGFRSRFRPLAEARLPTPGETPTHPSVATKTGGNDGDRMKDHRESKSFHP